MGTADIIASVAAGETVTTKKKVGGKKGVEMTVTRTAPPTVLVDETVVKVEPTAGLLPADSGKRTVEVLPGVKLVAYSKGYVTLRVKGKSFTGQKVEIGKPLYRDEITCLIEALLAEVEGAATYEEANGMESVPF